jgi:tetraacyldisaccharide 4'-kinase
MHAPKFWQYKHSLWRMLLAPASWLYYAGHVIKCRSTTRNTLNIPVICVGNLTVGGTGKTPMVAMLATQLKQHGHHPHIVSRGYSGNIRTTTQVQPHHSAQDVGDEPLLLTQHAPVWIGKNRAASGRVAHAAGATIIIMDDGFQNPSLHKDYSLIMVDGAVGFGNEALFPAGPLREPLIAGLKRADIMVIIGEDMHHCAARFSAYCTVAHASIKVDSTAIDTTRPVLAFCGIGRPEKFYTTLKQHDIAVVGTKNFSDHHHFTHSELAALAQQAHALNARLLTTEKDWLRLDATWKTRCDYLPITLECDDASFIMREFLDNT